MNQRNLGIWDVQKKNLTSGRHSQKGKMDRFKRLKQTGIEI